MNNDTFYYLKKNNLEKFSDTSTCQCVGGTEKGSYCKKWDNKYVKWCYVKDGTKCNNPIDKAGSKEYVHCEPEFDTQCSCKDDVYCGDHDNSGFNWCRVKDPSKCPNSVASSKGAWTKCKPTNFDNPPVVEQDQAADSQDQAATGQDQAATGQDQAATGQDQAATGQDQAATGQDQAATGQDQAETDKEVSTHEKVIAALDAAKNLVIDKKCLSEDELNSKLIEAKNSVICPKDYSNEIKELEGTVSGFKQKMIILGVVILILFLTALYFLFKGGNSGGSSDSGDFY
jgi:hypothetical protein